MKIFLLTADEDTLVGLRLAGVDGALVADEEQFVCAAQRAIEDKDTAVLLIGSDISHAYGHVLPELRKSKGTLITEVPDMNSTANRKSSVAGYVKEVVGIQLDSQNDDPKGDKIDA